MHSKVLFRETQRFTQWWIWLLVLVPVALLWVGYFNEAPDKKPQLWVIALINMLVILFPLILKLETRITEEGIDFRFFPFHIKFRHYGWEDISEKYVRTYSPIGEYGGWGVRGFGQNKAFNVSGNQGLQLIFKDGKRRLLGTRQPNKLQEVLDTVH